MPLLPLAVLCLHCNSFHPERCSLDSNPSLVDADNAELWNTTPCKPGEPYVFTRRNLTPLRGDCEATEFTKETSIVVVPASLSSPASHCKEMLLDAKIPVLASVSGHGLFL